MTATYTFDVFSSLDGYGSTNGDWTGYWGKQGPELLDRRHDLYGTPQRMVFGANTYREFTQMLADEHRGVRGPRPVGHQDVEHAGDGGVLHVERTPRLAGCDGGRR